MGTQKPALHPNPSATHTHTHTEQHSTGSSEN